MISVNFDQFKNLMLFLFHNCETKVKNILMFETALETKSMNFVLWSRGEKTRAALLPP